MANPAIEFPNIEMVLPIVIIVKSRVHKRAAGLFSVLFVSIFPYPDGYYIRAVALFYYVKLAHRAFRTSAHPPHSVAGEPLRNCLTAGATIPRPLNPYLGSGCARIQYGEPQDVL